MVTSLACAMQRQVHHLEVTFSVIMALKPHDPHLQRHLLSLSAPSSSCFNMSDIDSKVSINVTLMDFWPKIVTVHDGDLLSSYPLI